MSITRVRYREGQVLYRDDLLDEQSYRIAMRRRHNLAQHSWGIVQGLGLNSVAGSSEIELQAGLAIDGFGRELIVPESVYFTCDGFDFNGDLDVWLLYGLVPLSYSRRGGETCGPGRESRWREVARLRLTPGDQNIDPRHPVQVSEADLEITASDSLPDEPEREWPIYLGRITANGSNGSVDESRLQYRPYAGLVGESIVAASGQARMQVGAETAGDRRRFVVGIEDENREIKDRLVIDREGNTSHYGNAVLHGDLTIGRFPESSSEPDSCLTWAESASSGKVPPPPGIEFEPLAVVPEKAAPWSIYHAEIKSDEEGKREPSLHQLRFEIANPGDKGDPSRYLLCIGSWDSTADGNTEDDNFRPCLSVSSDCDVTIAGDLVIEGELVEGPIEADPNDPAFRDAVQERWIQGVGETAAKVTDGDYGAGLQIQILNPGSLTPSVECTLEITVRNSGHVRMSNVTLYSSITLTHDGVQKVTNSPPRRLGHLDSNQFVKVNVEYTPSEEGKLQVAATVSGVSPSGAITTATEKILVDVS